jgi:hypothetical protein
MSTASQGTVATPTPAGVTIQTGGASIDALQVQLAGQAQQVAVLRAQRAVIERQINITDPGPASAELIAQRKGLDDQLLKLQVDMAGSRAQIASRLGVPVERIGPNGRFLQQSFMDYGPRRGPDPDVIVGMSFALTIAIAFPLALAYARRIWRGKPSTQAQPDMIAPRLDRLEQAVEAIAIEVERVAEGQRFVTKVFAERPPQAHVNVAAESPLARDSASGGGLGEAKPFLALGAGPIEQIRVQERQAVRQSITPH